MATAGAGVARNMAETWEIPSRTRSSRPSWDSERSGGPRRPELAIRRGSAGPEASIRVRPRFSGAGPGGAAPRWRQDTLGSRWYPPHVAEAERRLTILAAQHGWRIVNR